MAGILSFATTEEINIPKKAIEQVIGQDQAVAVMKKAAQQKRHVLLIGEPGTGKSLLGVALAELLPKETLQDVLVYSNNADLHHPLIKTAPAGKGKEIVERNIEKRKNVWSGKNFFLLIVTIFSIIFPSWALYYFGMLYGYTVGAIIFAALLLTAFLIVGFLFFGMRLNSEQKEGSKPKVLVDNSEKTHAPFYDGTGSHAGALLGDILHDPYQSGGLGTPPHERVFAGLIHKAHQGVLFIDEVGTIERSTQSDILTALQEGKFAITGQSQFSAGAMVRTDPVPCQFILIAAGNMDNIREMHPALRSRIRGYGYEVYMNDTMSDTIQNREKLVQFVAQEIVKDGKIPHFEQEAVLEIIEEAKRRANKKGHLTLRLRDLGGLIRAAGDIAVTERAVLVTKKHVLAAYELSRTLEHQIADRVIEERRAYDVIPQRKGRFGFTNAIALLGTEEQFSGVLVPIEIEVMNAKEKSNLIIVGNVGKIIRESCMNVLALLEKITKRNHKIYVQFLSAEKIKGEDTVTLAVAAALFSSYYHVPQKQKIAITGGISVRGEAIRVGGISEKIHGAIEAGMETILVPESNIDDIPKDDMIEKKIAIVPVSCLYDVLNKALIWKGKEKRLQEIKNKMREDE